ncbi:general odorant-binding protein 57c-like [Teleopsis dalmanni]|uniref:general odorant-binding protein 57c-like n=1 Tax=Teleopsis dalmanni TaxID=139649 RepID=UPI0018CEDCDE|nr:general odorant-binding protein 57c-like [Teleopsis dalmanni]
MKSFVISIFIVLALTLLVKSKPTSHSAEEKEFQIATRKCQKKLNISDEEFEEWFDYDDEDNTNSTQNDIDDDEDSDDTEDDEDDEDSDDTEDYSEFDFSQIPKQIKCFANCLLEEMNLLDEYGKLDTKKVVKYAYSDDEDLEGINKCKTLHDAEEDACEYGAKIMVCYSWFLYSNATTTEDV